jgi:cholesterol transport system auxiliary component
MAGLAALALPGCTLPGGGPPPRRIRLNPATQFPPNMPSVGWKLVVDEPSATQSINNARIAIFRTDGSIEYLSTGLWASRSPEMVMELLVESFKNSNRILVVGDRRSRIRPDFELESRLTDFQVNSTGASGSGTGNAATVKVGLDVSLLRRPRRTALATMFFESEVQISQETLDSGVAAFDRALQDVMADVVDWTLRTGAGV